MEQESRRPETTTHLCTSRHSTAEVAAVYSTKSASIFLYFVHYRVSQCSKNIFLFETMFRIRRGGIDCSCIYTLPRRSSFGGQRLCVTITSKDRCHEAENRSSTSTCITVVQMNKGTMERKKRHRRSRTSAGRHKEEWHRTASQGVGGARSCRVAQN
ncbi:hypothetical protein AVEN_200087-1 [Araneus ventricosus]|uniref:Uncharacterized protein n=1 Tax=Araneus ventricosus TaxID=182803 RepID=A0A4Y2PNL2_ARAVE|nr:hypothetical protein AVEN_200087-1 [Araneus ventricosus]